jgi:hypothetical protein
MALATHLNNQAASPADATGTPGKPSRPVATLAQLLEALGMDRDGMFPPGPCRSCGKPLNADGNHPAELYAGTFTGLCYGCERAAPYVQRRWADGAQLVSHPPSCPSWRRDRETFVGYPDCPTCAGTGVEQTTWTSGGPVRHYCRACIARFSAWEVRARREDRTTWLRERADVVFERKLRAALGLPARTSRKRLRAAAAMPKEDLHAVARPIRARLDRMLALVEDNADRRGCHGWAVHQPLVSALPPAGRSGGGP